ncbi:ABC transporter ATP-binding protein [Desulfomarina sp.]
MNNSIFSIDHLSFAYKETPVLHDISLSLKEGRFYGIIGPNGCGKTTFLDLLIGNRKPDRGSIFFMDKRIEDYSRKKLAHRIALVPQEFSTGFEYTVEEIVLMGRHPYIPRFGSPSAEDWNHVRTAMETIGILGERNRQFTELSGGQKQRAVVARAFAQDTPVLLFDEATASLDIKYTLQIFNVAKKLVKSEKRTIIAVIHDLNLAAGYCDEILFMKKGRIHHFGATRQVMTPENILDVFGVYANISGRQQGGNLHVNFQPKSCTSENEKM